MSRKSWNQLICLAAALLLMIPTCACGNETPAPAPAASPPTAAPAPTATPKPVEAAAKPAETAAPEVKLPFSPDLEEQPPAADAFFEDSAFLGNSLVCGLELCGGLPGDFFAVTSASVVNIDLNKEVMLENGTKGTLLEGLFQKQYSRIYILLGINEISFEPEYFAELYGQLLDKLREKEPNAEIYIMGLTPVTEKKSAEGWLFSQERVTQYNEALRALAESRGCRYVNLTEALADETGYLPESASTDGIHLTPDKYPVWADYLRTHYAPETA